MEHQESFLFLVNFVFLVLTKFHKEMIELNFFFLTRNAVQYKRIFNSSFQQMS